ncbi:MAG: type II toxin-antitoxin system Phd/YefM family antitoxin [Opitutaceae bacterium]|jgi:prevent-host-death family protein
MKTELVTTLKRKATEIISTLQDDHTPVLITQHGRPAAYLIDVDTFEGLQKKLSILEGIALGEQAVLDGRTVSNETAKARFAKWLS